MIEHQDNLDVLYQQGIHELARLDHLQHFAHKQVAIVGSTGLIGSALLDVLLEANQSSALAESPMSIYAFGRQDLSLTDGFTYVQSSVTDVDLDQLPDIDDVIYVAGTTSDYRQQYENTINTQVVGLGRFLKRFRACERFIYISSARVYGQTKNTPVTEDHQAFVQPMHLDNIYNSAKHLGESLCLLYHFQENCNAVVLRPTNIYGLTERGANAKTAIREFVMQSIETNRIELRGHPDSVRNLCCVLDVVQAILKAIVSGRAGQAYNIGSDDNFSIGQLASTIGQCFDPHKKVQVAATDSPPTFQIVSIEKAKSELGYAPHYRFNDVASVVVQKTINAIQNS